LNENNDTIDREYRTIKGKTPTITKKNILIIALDFLVL
jgi:hypothetical protein